jgi:penicillin-binding protein 1C
MIKIFYKRLYVFLKGLEKSWKRWPNFLRYCILIVPGFVAAFILADVLVPLHPDIAYSQVILAADGSILHASLTPDQKWRIKADINDISAILQKTIIYKEDKYFYYHFGINPVAIARAAFKNLIRGERTSGASTITMQVIRLLHPKQRTYFNKVIEMFMAMQLELHYSKQQILQMYLSMAPYGSNIEGVKAASLLYFGQSPQALSLAQIVTLSVIPNNPSLLRPGINNQVIIKERNHWLSYFGKKHLFEKSVITAALREPIEMTRQEAPADVPHFSRQIAVRFRGSSSVSTFIDRRIQEMLENILFAEVRHTSNMNITNASAVIIDNKSGNIVAYAGSADFADAGSQGQVDGVIALRSPGSTLKPYLYALAIDKGIITPKMKLNDIPSNFNGYRPENYDQTFRGPVSMEQALEQSLNLPAVKLADEIGIDYFKESLEKAGFNWIGKHRRQLGLSIVLGGCGVRLIELTALYVAFANNGLYRPLRWTSEQPRDKPVALFSPEAGFMVTEILTQLRRPDLPTQFDNSVHMPHIAWKTGTSYGRHDAWSIGYNPAYTAGVWMGNFNGQGVAELNGSDFAAPLLFKIFNSIGGSQRWFTQPKGIDFRLVCAESGMPPDTFCRDHVMDYFIPGVSSNQKCRHMKEVFTDPGATKSYCTTCLPANGYLTSLYPDFSAEVLAYFDEQHIPYRKIPPHNPLCSRIYECNAPSITSLTDGMEYMLAKPAKQQLMLGCAAENGVKKVFWYIDNRFYKSSGPSEKLFFTPSAGNIKISCSDDKGRNSDIRIIVSYIQD